jgi:hypothetical protein
MGIASFQYQELTTRYIHADRLVMMRLKDRFLAYYKKNGEPKISGGLFK